MSNGRPVHHELISALHDGELTAAERDVAQRLLEDSADARAERDDFHALSELLGTLPRETAPADLKSAVLRHIATPPKTVAAVSPTATRAPHLKRGLLALVGGLTAAAGLLLAVNLFQNRNEDQFATSVADAEPAGPAMTHPAPANAGAAGAGIPEADASPLFMEESSPALREFSDRIVLSETVAPDDASPGDIYRVLEQTADGNVVVVDATVVDVRKALDQVQLLLTNNSIRTVPVGLDATASERGRLPAANGNLAVYVESEPGQMNGALQALDSALADKESQILGLQVAGVLDSPPVAQRSAASASQDYYFEQSPAGDTTAAKALRASGAPGASGQDRAERMGQARYSVPNEPQSFGIRPMVAPAEPPASARSTTASEDREDAPAPDSEMAVVPRPTKEAGYQQIVNFSKDEWKGQLRRQNREPEGRQRTLQKDFARDSSNTPADAAGTLTANDPQIADEKLMETGQRRLRLLLVLEAELPAKADASVPAPVEAPRPIPTKG